MGAFIIFLLILYAVYFDAKTLRNENQALYQKNIGHSPWFWPLINLFLFIVVSPIYLVRRTKFLRQLRVSFAPGDPVYSNAHFSAIAEFMGVVLTWCFFGNCILIASHALGGHFAFLQDKLMAIVIAGLLSDIVMIVLMYRSLRRQHQGGFWSNVCFKKIDGLFFKGIILPVIVGASFAGLAFMISESKVAASSPLQHMLSKSSITSIVLFSLMAMVSGPLFEEIVFRGYLFTFVSKLKSRLFTIGFVACVFAVMHLDQLWGDWMRFVVIFLMGLCITFFRARSGSIIPGISAHYSYNISLLFIPAIYLCLVNPAYCEYALKAKTLDEAKQVQLLKESIHKDPTFYVAYNDLAWLYAEHDKNLPEALRLIEMALRAKPNKAAFLDTKAEVLFKLGRVDEAIVIEKRLIKKYPADDFYKKQLKKFLANKSGSAPDTSDD